MHYFSPVDKMELLEIIRTKQTSDDTICSAVNLGLKQGKIVIVVNDSPGFYTTRLLIFSAVELFRLLQDGVSPTDIDKATKQFGFHVGLASLVDEVGIDVTAFITGDMQKVFGDRLADSSIIELFQIFIKNNFLGRKSGQGLYTYREGGKKEMNLKLNEIIHSTKVKQM
jgi:enoyl-CoA hydratase/long-chain 3-hydroxyacyl-CoA dehydrogenase